MTYSVKTTNEGSTITVATGEVSTKYGVALVGRNVSGYGQFFVQNTLWMLENFASTSSPVARGDSALVGQHWYNTTDNTMRVYDGTVWRRQTPLIASSAPTSDLGAGTGYFDTVDNKERIYDGTTWRDVTYPGTITSKYSAEKGGSTYGSRVRTLYLTDSTATKRAVTAFVYVNDGTQSGYTSNETIMAIFSDYPTFTLTPSSLSTSYRDSETAAVDLYAEFYDADGIGLTIKPGMNLRRAYKDTSVPLADLATSATSANALLVGGSIISSSNFFHTGSSSIAPDTTDAVNLGESAARWNNAYLGGSIVLGDGSAGSAVTHTISDAGGLSELSVGTTANPVKTLYVEDIHMNGSIVGLSAASVDALGSSSNYMGNAYLSKLHITSTQSIDTTGIKGLDLKATDGTVIFDASTGNLQNTSLSKVLTETASGGITAFSYNGAANVTVGVDGTVIRTTGTQSIGGAKTFTSEAIFNAGAKTGDVAPIVNDTSDLGSASFKYAEVFATAFTGVASSAKYADMAEIYSADADYEPGTVVKIGGDAEITMTKEHADTDVFGVISTNPAYLMNSEAEGLPVALSGKVPVKVIGKIKKGERIVSSDVPGVAWALGEDDYDTRAIVGRALQDKEDGDEGTIDAVIGVS